MNELVKNKEYSRIIFIAGMHSSGKSKLLSMIPKMDKVILWPRLARKELFSEAQYRANTLSVHDSRRNYQRLQRRLADCFDEFFYQKKFIELNPEYFIISDRCPLDVLSYIKACADLGWIKKHETEEIRGEFNRLFDLDELQCGIFLEPLVRDAKKEFFNRINLKNSKDWEIKSGFLKSTHLAFRDVYHNHISSKSLRWIVIESSALISSHNKVVDYIKSVTLK